MENSYNIVNIIILVAFTPALVSGLRTGLVRQLAAFIALIAGAWAGWHFSTMLASLFKKLFEWEGQLVHILAFIVLFIGAIFLVNLVGKTIASLLSFLMLGWVDRLLGVLFSIIKYAFIFSILIYILESIDSFIQFLPKELLSSSQLYGAIKGFAPSILPYLKRANIF